MCLFAVLLFVHLPPLGTRVCKVICVNVDTLYFFAFQARIRSFVIINISFLCHGVRSSLGMSSSEACFHPIPHDDRCSNNDSGESLGLILLQNVSTVTAIFLSLLLGPIQSNFSSITTCLVRGKNVEIVFFTTQANWYNVKFVPKQ